MTKTILQFFVCNKLQHEICAESVSGEAIEFNVIFVNFENCNDVDAWIVFIYRFFLLRLFVVGMSFVFSLSFFLFVEISFQFTVTIKYLIDVIDSLFVLHAVIFHFILFIRFISFVLFANWKCTLRAKHHLFVPKRLRW